MVSVIKVIVLWLLAIFANVGVARVAFFLLNQPSSIANALGLSVLVLDIFVITGYVTRLTIRILDGTL